MFKCSVFYVLHMLPTDSATLFFYMNMFYKNFEAEIKEYFKNIYIEYILTESR